jgi:hypothetical protein
MRIAIFLSLILASGLSANEIGVSAPDGKSGWLLLENPPGEGGQELSPFAGDPGFPVPDPMGWPWNDNRNAKYPPTELWHFDGESGKYTRLTNVLGGGDNRTLYSVFEIGGVPYVLHYNPNNKPSEYTQIARADGLANAGGSVPAAAVVLSAEFFDSPTVSPDGKLLAVRAFRGDGKVFKSWLRFYRTTNWTLAAESVDMPAGRPVWIDNSSVAVIAWEDAIPRPPQRRPGVRAISVNESHEPATGKLLKLTVTEEGCDSVVLLDGKFPPDRTTQSVLADPTGLGLIVARADGDGVLVEMREPSVGGKAQEIARFSRFRGMSLGAENIYCAGVRVIGGRPTLMLGVHDRKTTPVVEQLPAISPDPHGGMIDLGHGVHAFIEAVVNPDLDRSSTDEPLLRHALAVPAWRCDSLRNPRQLARLSKLVRRFDEVAKLYPGGIPSTLLIYDIEIKGQNQKKGRYVELYSRTQRDGKGAIRTEDNLGGEWFVQAIDEAGGNDLHFDSSTVNNGRLRQRPAEQAGKSYDDLLTQLETRKLLILTGVERSLESGGLQFRGREYYRDPAGGTSWRVWVFERLGRMLENGKHERVELRFVAQLPGGTGGVWQFPHALARAKVAFALSGRKEAAVTDLAFEPDRFTELPNLTDLAAPPKTRPIKPPLLLPAVFRIYESDGKGKVVERLYARAAEPPASQEYLAHPQELTKSAKIRAGYEVPLANERNSRIFREMQR